MRHLRHAAVSGFKWMSLAQGGRQAMVFGFTAVLAYLLAPSDYGLLGMATVVTGFIQIFKDLGTTAAIVQKADTGTALLSTVFWANVLIGLAFMALTLAAAPMAALFYREPRVTGILQVLSLSFLVSGLGVLHNALLQKGLRFEALAKIDLFSAMASGVTGVALALLGAGVWSLVVQALAAAVFSTAALWHQSRWRPRMLFRWNEIGAIRSFSLNLMGFNVFNYFARNADYIIIGRVLGAADLGYYTLAYRLMLYPLQNVSAVIGQVLFPLLSAIQDDNERFKKIYLNVCGAIAIVTFPMMIGMWCVAEPMVIALLGEKWRPTIALFMILAPVGLAQSIGTTVGSIYQAKGRTDLAFRWGVGAGSFITAGFLVGIHWGVRGVAWSYFLSACLLTYPNYAIPFRLIDLKINSLFKMLTFPFICALVMLAALLAINAAGVSRLAYPLQLAVLIPAGMVVYGAVSWGLNREQIRHIWATLAERPV